MQITILRFDIALNLYEVRINGLLYWYDPHWTVFNDHGSLMHHMCPSLVDIAATMSLPMNDIWHAQVDFYEERLTA